MVSISSAEEEKSISFEEEEKSISFEEEEKVARKAIADWKKSCHITAKLHEAILQLSKIHSNLRINAVVSDESDSSAVYEINTMAEVIKDLEVLENEADTISKTLFNAKDEAVKRWCAYIA